MQMKVLIRAIFYVNIITDDFVIINVTMIFLDDCFGSLITEQVKMWKLYGCAFLW